MRGSHIERAIADLFPEGPATQMPHGGKIVKYRRPSRRPVVKARSGRPICAMVPAG
ncbi:hypothetical protein Axi01nite_54710 [Actinoplanes xinjiangensis]|nr:hypothetical protein Axi01nite_54710 [Actinoplanes xinjiangensis]